MARKNKAEVQSNMLAVAEEILAGDKTNLNMMEQVIVEAVANMPAEQLLPVVEAKVKKVGIGSTIIEMILAHPEMTNQQILDEVKTKFETAETSYACIAWYKSKLRKEGKIGPRVFVKKVKPQEQAAE